MKTTDTATFIQDIAFGTDITDILSTSKDETFLSYPIVRQLLIAVVGVLSSFKARWKMMCLHALAYVHILNYLYI